MSEQGKVRRRMILDQARDNGGVQVTELAAGMNVAAETVRRDLRTLEEEGLLRRTHGGAHPLENARVEGSSGTKSGPMTPQDALMAEAVQDLVAWCESLFIDDGPEALAVAERLAASRRPLSVVTGALAVATLMAKRENITVIVLGGRVRPTARAIAGAQAVSMMSDFKVDAALMSSGGISLEGGLTVPDPETAELKRVALRSARQRIFVGEHSKFGVISLCRYGGVEDLDAIVTDAGISGALAGRYRAVGVRLVRA